MKRISLLLMSVMMSTMPSLAALPPHFQRQAEIDAVLQAAVEILGVEQPVDAIRFIETDRYEVLSGACTMVVRIIDTPGGKTEGWVGPRQFTALPEAPKCPPVR
ncbi:MAG: hypothetical protein KIS86_18660 [Devosia sp.]|nr:hypothetical protein [Devosia sp.]